VEWWQIGLIFLATIPFGVATGGFISYLYLRFGEKSEVNLPTVFSMLASKKRGATSRNDLASRFASLLEIPPVVKEEPVQEQSKFTLSGLLTEVKRNRKMAGEVTADSLQLFQTKLWDAHQYRVDDLPTKLRDDLEQVYIDMHLANNIVWLSTEFGRRTPEITENYTKLCTRIVQGLDRIEQRLESGFAE
jgi:hypothetical protein